MILFLAEQLSIRKTEKFGNGYLKGINNLITIQEVALLMVRKGQEDQFEKDFRKAGKYISSIKGYKSHSLKKCIEQTNKYLLLVDWNTLEDHTEGFRKSEQQTLEKLITSLL